MMFLANMMENTYRCGTFDLEFTGTIPYLVHAVYVAIKIVVPILLILFGMLDLGKAVVASKEDEIKKGQQMFIKRAVSALIVFFVFQVVQLLIRFVSAGDVDVLNCLNCFINGKEADNACILVDKIN